MFNKLRELFAGPEDRSATSPSESQSGFSRDRAAALLEAMKSGKLAIPEDIHDAKGWDRYWSAQLEFGAMEQGFGDMMASDDTFIPRLARRNVHSILCVGNGLSSEAWALALHGFDVTGLDVSSVPKAIFASIIADPDHRFRKVPGFTARGHAAIAFEGTAPIDPACCPRMHQAEGYPPKGGGSLTYVTGDLCDIAACAGPFDVVIERRTVQLFKAGERSGALERLAGRLGPRGLLVSHEHCGGWRPGQPREHFAATWVRENGFEDDYRVKDDSAARVARLFFTTG